MSESTPAKHDGRAVLFAVVELLVDTREDGPCLWLTFLMPVNMGHEHGTWTWVVCTGYGPCWKKHSTAMLFSKTGRVQMPVHATHVHGPWTWAVNTGIIWDTHVHGPWTRPWIQVVCTGF